MLVKLVLMWIMAIVQLIRRDKTNYLTAPEDTFSPAVLHRTQLMHYIPTAILAGYIALSVIPVYSAEYAAKLAQNDSIIMWTIIGTYVLLLILAGFIIEINFEKRNAAYKALKEKEREG